MGMPPQLNCPPATVSMQLMIGVSLKEWCFIFRLNLTWQPGLKRLPLTLHIKARVEITGYSKVSRGLHDPLGVFGLHTEESVRKVLDRDSGQLVTPFMHVVNQTTRYFATLREL